MIATVSEFSTPPLTEFIYLCIGWATSLAGSLIRNWDIALFIYLFICPATGVHSQLLAAVVTSPNLFIYVLDVPFRLARMPGISLSFTEFIYLCDRCVIVTSRQQTRTLPSSVNLFIYLSRLAHFDSRTRALRVP